MMDIEAKGPLLPECCGMGCKNCVLDLYAEELELVRRMNRSTPGHENKESLQLMSSNMYISCEIAKVERHNRVCCIYTFKLPENHVVQSKSGDHLIARETIDGEFVARCYTLLNTAEVGREFSVLVKTYEAGIMSKAVVDRWIPGHIVDWRGPLGGFSYKTNSYRKIMLLAAGTGIVPLYRVAQQIVENEDDETLVKLILCCRKYDEVPLREEVRELQQYWNFQSSVYLSGDNDDCVAGMKRYNETITCERLTEESLQREIGLFGATVGETLVLVCGTKGFESEFTSFLINDLGFPQTDVVKC